MRKIIAILMLVIFAACSSSIPQQPTTPKPEPSPADTIFSPEEEKPEDLSGLEYYDPIVLMKDDVSPQDGNLYSARQSAKCSLDSAAVKRLTVDKKVLANLRLFENNEKDKYILTLETSLKDATKKTWWDINKDWIYLGSGAVLGVALSVAIFSIAVDIKKQGD